MQRKKWPNTLFLYLLLGSTSLHANPSCERVEEEQRRIFTQKISDIRQNLATKLADIDAQLRVAEQKHAAWEKDVLIPLRKGDQEAMSKFIPGHQQERQRLHELVRQASEAEKVYRRMNARYEKYKTLAEATYKELNWIDSVSNDRSWKEYFNLLKRYWKFKNLQDRYQAMVWFSGGYWSQATHASAAVSRLSDYMSETLKS